MVVSLAISSAVSFLVGQIIDFTAQKGIEKIVTKVFPKDSYATELTRIIYKTIEEFEKKNPSIKDGNRFPFYHSQILLCKLPQNPNAAIDFDSAIDGRY